MSADTDLWFAEVCEPSFQFLVDRYGFSGPIPSRGGNEFTVSYSKEKKIVSISIEPGGRPVVEFYAPTADIAHRSFPKFRPLPSLAGRSEAEAIPSDLLHWAMELESKNREFLSDESKA
jgi:hypothetical protein